MFRIKNKNGSPTGEPLSPVFTGQKEYYFKVPTGTPKPEAAFSFLECKDAHELWAVPFDKVVPYADNKTD